MASFPKGSLVLHFWVGSNVTLVLTPTGIKRLSGHDTADEMLAVMKERGQVGTYDDPSCGPSHIIAFSIAAQHDLLCGQSFTVPTADGSWLSGPVNWGHA